MLPPKSVCSIGIRKKLCTLSLARPHAGYGDGIGNGIEDFKVNDPDDGMLGGLHV